MIKMGSIRGVSYQKSGLQARAGKKSKYFGFKSCGGWDAAHLKAKEWLAIHKKAEGQLVKTAVRMKPGTSGNGILFAQRLRNDIHEYSWRVVYRDESGKVRSKTFFIGSDNTWTKKREALAWRAAYSFRINYEAWRIFGGRHPINDPIHAWHAGDF